MIENYYNELAPYFKYIHQDWEASVKRQAAILDSVIREFFDQQVRHVLDATCGIGTQSLGLAQLGYTVSASDISSAEIDLARTEAEKRGLSIDFTVADMRQLAKTHCGLFDLVIACDNAIPHLLTDEEIRQAFEQFYQCTTAAGGCIISVRDYANIERGGKRLYPRTTHDTPDGRVLLFDLWEFDGNYYDFTTYIIEDKGQPTARAMVIRGGRYYCVAITTLEMLLTLAGFQKVVTLRDRFYQPLMVATKTR